jgi:hypothetical protein
VIKAGNLAGDFEGFISKAAAEAGTTHGHEVGYVWTHGMVPLQNGGATFGMVIEISISSPLLGVPRITHTMIMDQSIPSEAEIKAAVTEAVSQAAKIYQQAVKLPRRPQS